MKALLFLKDFLDSRVDKQVTTDTLIELAEFVLKNNIFEFSDETNKQICGKVKNKPSVWWRYIDDIFFIWEHGERIS